MGTLSDLDIRNAKPRRKAYKLFDGEGLFLLVAPGGGRWWRFKYRLRGREKGISLGTYPEVSLKAARKRLAASREKVANGIDPSAERQREKAALGTTFEAVSREWLAKQRLAGVTQRKTLWMFEAFLFPKIGSIPIAKLTAKDLLDALRPIKARGKLETAHRTKQHAGRVLRYAVATDRAERDVSADLRGALAPVKVTNRAAITEPTRIGELLRAIEGYSGQSTTAAALKLSPMLFVRPGELRGAEWREFSLDGPEPTWRIPAARTKMRREHLVPLSSQAVEILRELQALTGSGRLVFPSLLDAKRPMSDGTVNASLRRLGFDGEEMCGHGFRAMASTLLNEQAWPPDVIELQLAHGEPDKVRGAYNRAKRLSERRRMMQAWSDYLDDLRRGADVVPLRKNA